MSDQRSRELFAESKRYFPGGVNSPVRAFRAVGGKPVFISRAEGAHIFAADGTKYIDYVGSWGPMILGHAHPVVVKALQEQAALGTSYGAPTAQELELGRLVQDTYPSMEMMRFVSSGTEATMSAIRVARGATGRPAIVKMEGCYHGHADYLLVKAGSGAATFGAPDSAGVPEDFARHTITVPFNDLARLEQVFEEAGERIAALILEPVAGNMGCVPPIPGYLDACRDIAHRAGSLIIFDEVMSGFRVARGGAQERFGVKPDLTCLGKVIGGGMPVGAYGGRKDLMEQVSPLGPIYQAGTLSGNPMAMVAGIETLKLIAADGVYEGLEATGKKLEEGFRGAAKDAGVPVTVQRVGTMLTVFFPAEAGRPIRNFDDSKACDADRFAEFFTGLLAEGIYFPPSSYETAFVSMAHDETVVDATIGAATKVFAALS